MTRRNFIIVDDMPSFGEQVTKSVSQYYNSRRIYEYDIKQFLRDSHFADAMNYIRTRYDNIDVIFSDQDLRGGSGTDLFKTSNKTIPTDYPSIVCKTQIFKVMHSNKDSRLKEYQDEYSLTYNYFVNSENERDVALFLDYYEEKIISVKTNGNTVYNNYLYSNPALQHVMNTDTVVVDKQEISLKRVLFLVMDKDESNSEYYYFYYTDGEKILKSKKSKKTDSEVNNKIKSLSFLNGNLQDGNREKFKINPLWISCVDNAGAVIKLLMPVNVTYEIAFEKLTSQYNLGQNILDKFFL